jgi:hypothetical protein
LRIGRRRLHDIEQARILIPKRFHLGVEVCRGNSEFIASSDLGRKHVGEILVRAYRVVAGKVECLPRQVRQRSLGVDLRAPLLQDRFELVDSRGVGVERVRL